jgi:hypothetical protein
MSLRFLAITISFLVIFISCDKDENKVEEKPILTLLNQQSIVIDTLIATEPWIYGFKFTTVEDGKIKGLGMKVPKNGSYKAKLWNLDNGELIKEEIITSNAAHGEIFKSISEISVKKNTNLGISIEADSFYKIRKSDNSNFTFPIETGNIRILSFHESKISENISGKFPSMTKDDEMSPCVDVIFISE